MMNTKAKQLDRAATKALGLRKNGKQWHEPKKAFRPGSGLTSYVKRAQERIAQTKMKTKEKELKDEKEAERVADEERDGQKRVTALKEKRAAKAEKERYEKLAENMHKKRVERLKRKEKRNKLLNS